jgi:transposase
LNITTIGIDIVKNVSQLHGTNQQGKVVRNRRLRRDQFLRFMQKHFVCLLGIEACCGAHYGARKLQECGHTVKSIAPQYVQPYVKLKKNNYNDADEVNQAVSRHTMRFVGIKPLWQRHIKTIHRILS